jgi:murein DD-endopeptidase MepM/ murein hydrolase activator NlpD
VSRDDVWEIQWHPASGRAPRCWLLGRAARRRLAVTAAAATLAVLGFGALLPSAVRALVSRWSIDATARENRRLHAAEDERREVALALVRTLAVRIDRSRRLAWSLELPSGVWRGAEPPPPPADAGDAAVLAWLDDASARVERLATALTTERPAVPCALGALPTAPAIDPALSVPVALYGWRTSPFTGEREAHYGVTLASPLRRPVLAPGGGVVRYVGTPREKRSNEWTRFGNVVVIDHGGGVTSVLGGFATMAVQSGTHVRRGETIGSVGQSAWTRVPALYFEVRWPTAQGNRPIDPALVNLCLPLPDPGARFERPWGDLPADFARLDHLGWRRR